MRRTISISLIAALALVSLAGSVLASDKQFINLSFFQPIATNGKNTDIETNFRLNLIYGHVGEIRGVDLNGLVSKVNRKLAGKIIRGIAHTGHVDYEHCPHHAFVQIGDEVIHRG